MTHLVAIIRDLEATSREDDQWRAVCSCDWTGPWHVLKIDAASDAGDHILAMDAVENGA